MFIPLLNLTKSDAVKLTNKTLENRAKDRINNLKMNLAFIKDEIKKSAKSGNFKVQITIPINPEEDSGNQQFLITNKSKKETFCKNGYYDPELIEIVEKEGFKTLSKKKKRDSMSGVAHMKITFSWE
jgi:hypothetical protein